MRNVAERLLHRLGLDVVRYPSSRLRSGHTLLVLEQLEIDVVLDVGANKGQYGQFLRSIGYRGPIISFEPVPSVADELDAVAASQAPWRVVRAALGSADGEATINVTRAPVMSSLRRPTDEARRGIGADIDVVGSEVVPVRRLDSLFPELLPADSKVFLKLAVQGSDLEVLGGVTGCLENVCAIQSIVSVLPLYEGMPDWLESLTYMRDLGFEPSGFFPVLHFGTLHVAEFDAVMVRPVATD